MKFLIISMFALIISQSTISYAQQTLTCQKNSIMACPMFRSPLFSNKTVEIKKAPVAAKKKPGPKIVYFTEKDFKAKPATASTTPGGKGRRDPASANLSRAMIEHTRAPAGLDNQIAAAADSK